MLLAQVLIPLAAAAAVLFSAWFIVDLLRRDQGSEAARAAGSAVRDGLAALARRQLVLTAAFAAVAGAAAGLVAWYYEDSVEIGLIASACALAGSASCALAVHIGLRLGSGALTRVATVAGASHASALGSALAAAAVPGLLAAGLNLAGIAGAFAIITRFLGYPAAQAPYLLVAFALGASTVALVTRVSGGIFANAASLAADLAPGSASPSETAIAGHQAASSGSVADVSESAAIQAVAAMLLGVSLATVSGDIEWLLLPLALGGVGVFATIAASIAAQILATRAPAPGRLVARVTGFSVVLGAAGLGAVSWALLGDAWYWFFLSGLVGIAAGPGLMLLVRYSRLGPSSAARRVARASSSGPASNVITGLAAGFEATAITAVTVAMLVVAAFALGYQADVEYVSGTSAGLFGIAVAAAGFMLPGPFLATLPVFAAVATGASTVAAAEPRPEADPGALAAFESLAANARAAAHLSRTYSLAAAGMTVVLALLAFGEVIRANLASFAVDDPERYATLAQDLDLLQPGKDLKFAAANAVDADVASLVELRESVAGDSRFTPWHIMRLAVADRREAEGLAAALVDRDDLTPRQASTIQPSPLALPRLLPLSFSRPEVLAAAFIGLTLVLLAGATVIRSAGRSAGRLIDEFDRRRTDAAGDLPASEPMAASAARSAIRAVLLVAAYSVVVPVAIGAAGRYGFGGDGNHGWLAVAGVMLAAGIGGVLLASFLEAADAVWSGASASLAFVPEPADDVSPAPRPDPAVLSAAAVGDTVGATFRDAAAPALVVVAKLLGALALALAPLFVA